MNSTYDILFKNHDPDDGIIQKSKVSHTSILTKYNKGTHISHICLAYRSLQPRKMKLRSSGGLLSAGGGLAQTQQGEVIVHDFWLGLVQNKQFGQVVVHEHV